MNYEAKRLKAIELMAKSQDRGNLYGARMIQYHFDRATNVAKVDIRHANGILDRLLKGEFCTYLMEEEEVKEK